MPSAEPREPRLEDHPLRQPGANVVGRWPPRLGPELVLDRCQGLERWSSSVWGLEEICHQHLKTPRSWSHYREEAFRQGLAPDPRHSAFHGLQNPEAREGLHVIG